MDKLDRCVVCGRLFKSYWRNGWEEIVHDEKHMCYSCRTEILDALYGEENKEESEDD